MVVVDVKLTDNTGQVKKALDKQIENALFAIGVTAEKHAKEYEVRVDTSRLRNSITFATEKAHSSGIPPAISEDYALNGTPEKNTVYIGTNVPYAIPVEYGTSKMGGIHFLKNGVLNHIDEYKKILNTALKS